MKKINLFLIIIISAAFILNSCKEEEEDKEPPQTDFKANTTNILEGEIVNFTDLSTNNPTFWSWDFGDGGTSLTKNPSHTYNEGGKYTVNLTASNTYGSDTETKIDYITVIGNCGTITDIDGNIYNTVKIGTQCWMKNNLKTTHYRDGTAIPNVADNSTWENTTSGAYCWYNNDHSTYGNTYGALYNWYAVNAGNLCPCGWHVPSDGEWKTLEMYLGMTQAEADGILLRGTDQGSKLAGDGFLWKDGDLESNSNFGSSGFSALPGGYRSSSSGSFIELGYGGSWWSSSKYNDNMAWMRELYYFWTSVTRDYYSKKEGYSVRCVRDY
jgi:uncharacterized protein (TIGR02145 family)